MKMETRAFLRDSAFLFAVAALDQIIKAAVRRAPVGMVLFDSPLLAVCRVENTGAAFGIFSAHPVGVTLFSALLMIPLAWYMYPADTAERKECAGRLAWILLYGGGAGNLLDRLLHGSVTDYILLRPGRFLFNLADICITAAVLLFLLQLLREGTNDGRTRTS